MKGGFAAPAFSHQGHVQDDPPPERAWPFAMSRKNTSLCVVSILRATSLPGICAYEPSGSSAVVSGSCLLAECDYL